MRPCFMVIVDVHLSWSSLLLITIGAGTVLLWTGIYSAKHEVAMANRFNAAELWKLLTLLIAVGILMIMPLLMPGGVL